MKKVSPNAWVGILVILIILISGTVYLSYKNKQMIKLGVIDTPVVNEPQSVQDTSQTTGAGAASISYTNALVKYADRRIQLDTTCQARPNTATYKDNTGIMIDNRSPQTRTVKVGITFTIKPWGFKIVVLPDIYLANKTLLVDCDGSQNVATILVQE